MGVCRGCVLWPMPVIEILLREGLDHKAGDKRNLEGITYFFGQLQVADSVSTGILGTFLNPSLVALMWLTFFLASLFTCV